MEGEGQQAKRSQEPRPGGPPRSGLFGCQGQRKKSGHASPMPPLEPPGLHPPNPKASKGPGPTPTPRPGQQSQPADMQPTPEGLEDEEAGSFRCQRTYVKVGGCSGQDRRARLSELRGEHGPEAGMSGTRGCRWPWGEGQRVSPQGCVTAALAAASWPLLGRGGGGENGGGSKSSRWVHSSWAPRRKCAIHCCSVSHTVL